MMLSMTIGKISLPKRNKVARLLLAGAIMYWTLR